MNAGGLSGKMQDADFLDAYVFYSTNEFNPDESGHRKRCGSGGSGIGR